MNTYKMVPAEIMTQLDKLKKKHYEILVQARVRIEAMFVTTDGEDGSPLKYAGCPASIVTKIVGQIDRVGSKCDVRILIAKNDWDTCTKEQQTALLDRALHFIQVKMKDGIVVTDGNDRPKLSLRRPDRMFAWFDVIAARHGINSLEVQEAKQVADNAKTYLPGFEFMAQPAAKDAKVVQMPKQAKDEPASKQAAAAK